MLRPAQHHEIDEGLERRALFGEGVRPQLRVALVEVDEPEEVVDPPLHRLAGRLSLAVERVALEVEEQVAEIGAGQRAERLRMDDLVGRHGDGRGGRGEENGCRRGGRAVVEFGERNPPGNRGRVDQDESGIVGIGGAGTPMPAGLAS